MNTRFFDEVVWKWAREQIPEQRKWRIVQDATDRFNLDIETQVKLDRLLERFGSTDRETD